MSTTPNAWLSNLYGTAPSEQEKQAAIQDAQDAELWDMFKAAAAEDGIDADQLSDEQVEELSSHYINEAGAGPGAEAGDDSGELPPNWDGDDVDHFNSLDSEQEKQAFVQFKEADLVGKIMAHSMFSEMDKLAMPSLGEYKQVSQAIKDRASQMGPMTQSGARAHGLNKSLQNKYRAGAAMGGLALAGGAALGAKKLMGKKKEPEAEKQAQAQKVAEIIEATAVERARNFLKEAGIDPDTGEEFGGEEQDFDLADIDEGTASEIADERAMDILKEAGWLQ